MDSLPHGATAIVIAAFVVYRLYKRFRSHIGRQPVRRNAMIFRISLFCVIAVALQALPHLTPYARIEELAGIAAGIALAWWGLRMTRFSADGPQRYYTPNTWLGLAVASLLIVRIAWRYFELAPVLNADAAAGHVPLPMSFSGPQAGITLALFGMIAGYYVAYLGGVLRLSRRAELAPALTPAAADAG